MKTSSTGRALIESFEGFFSKAYDDANDHVLKEGETPKGVLTIGYGHTSAAGLPKVFVGQTMTKEEADKVLSADLAKVEADVTKFVKVPINQNQFDALVSFHYNTGALGRSSLLQRLNQKDYAGAAEGLMAWTKASQIGPGPIPGLVRRRQTEKNLFLKPVTPSGAGAGAAAAVIVAGGSAAAAAQTGYHWGYIAAGLIAAAAMIWYLIHTHNKQESVPNVPIAQ